MLAERKNDRSGPWLHVYCNSSGGFILRGASWREKIFRSKMSFMLEALKYGDLASFESDRQLDKALARIDIQTSRPESSKIEKWGIASDYRI